MFLTKKSCYFFQKNHLIGVTRRRHIATGKSLYKLETNTLWPAMKQDVVDYSHVLGML